MWVVTSCGGDCPVKPGDQIESGKLAELFRNAKQMTTNAQMGVLTIFLEHGWVVLLLANDKKLVSEVLRQVAEIQELERMYSL